MSFDDMVERIACPVCLGSGTMWIPCMAINSHTRIQCWHCFGSGDEAVTRKEKL